MMLKRIFITAVFAGSSLCLLNSCGRGGATLTTGNVEGSWMPEGSNVKADLGPVTIVEEKRRSVPSAMSAATADIPETLLLTVESNDRGHLYIDGEFHSCSLDFVQMDLAFVLKVVTDDRSINLVFNDGVLPSLESDRATASWTLERTGTKAVKAQGTSAQLIKEQSSH